MTTNNTKHKIIPTSFEEAEEIAKHLAKSSFVPKAYKEAGQAHIPNMVASIVWGAELGFSPIKSLQYINIIPSREPSLSTEALRAIVLGSGECEYLYTQPIPDEQIEGQPTNAKDDSRGMQAVVKRKGGFPEHRTNFTVADAKRAGLWKTTDRPGDSSPWAKYPRRMLATRAMAFALRDQFADVLGGISLSTEEQMDMNDIPSAVGAPEVSPAEQAPVVSATAYLAQMLEQKVFDSLDQEDENDAR